MKAVLKESLFLVVKTSKEIQKMFTTKRKSKIIYHPFNSKENANSYPFEKYF
jgi:hypothetical protein